MTNLEYLWSISDSLPEDMNHSMRNRLIGCLSVEVSAAVWAECVDLALRSTKAAKEANEQNTEGTAGADSRTA